jgi:hypothetical protein
VIVWRGAAGVDRADGGRRSSCWRNMNCWWMTTSSICREERGKSRGMKNKKDGKKKRHPIAEIALFRKRLKEWIKTSTL